jgi:hypothetical protein
MARLFGSALTKTGMAGSFVLHRVTRPRLKSALILKARGFTANPRDENQGQTPDNEKEDSQ